LVGVEVKKNYGTTLHASNGNEEAGVHKEQGCGMICGSKSGKCIHDPTHQCDLVNFGG
jgi:hypothetical protein